MEGNCLLSDLLPSSHPLALKQSCREPLEVIPLKILYIREQEPQDLLIQGHGPDNHDESMQFVYNRLWIVLSPTVMHRSVIQVWCFGSSWSWVVRNLFALHTDLISWER